MASCCQSGRDVRTATIQQLVSAATEAIQRSAHLLLAALRIRICLLPLMLLLLLATKKTCQRISERVFYAADAQRPRHYRLIYFHATGTKVGELQETAARLSVRLSVPCSLLETVILELS